MAIPRAAMIIIKRPRRAADGHHGGAWKIAYADFVTAMMAFFLLLWLLASTTEEQRKGISDYFSALPVGTGAGEGVLQGKVIDTVEELSAREITGVETIELIPAPGYGVTAEEPSRGRRAESAPAQPGDAHLQAAQEARDEAAFTTVEQALEKALDTRPELAANLLIERTPDGLRIQIIDQERSPMFASGSAVLAPRMEQLLKLVGGLVAGVPNTIAVAGHTDAAPFMHDGYGNWELSADRANAARRLLTASGVPEARFVRVQGLADRQPLIAQDPLAPSNRRISVLLMKGGDAAAVNG